MASVSKQFLSGSTNGRNIKVAATATAGTLIHTADSTAKDEIWAWATNTSTSDVKLTQEWGGVTSPDDLIEVTIPAEAGDYPIVRGLPLSGGVVFRAFAASANVINI